MALHDIGDPYSNEGGPQDDKPPGAIEMLLYEGRTFDMLDDRGRSHDEEQYDVDNKKYLFQSQHIFYVGT